MTREALQTRNSRQGDSTGYHACCLLNHNNDFLCGLFQQLGWAGFECSDEEAVRWYKLAAAQGHAEAQLELSQHYSVLNSLNLRSGAQPEYAMVVVSCM